MHRIDTPAATGGNQFTDGNPAIPILATELDAAWANAVQEEIANVVESAGIALSKPDRTQLKQAIDFKVAAAFSSAQLYFMCQF